MYEKAHWFSFSLTLMTWVRKLLSSLTSWFLWHSCQRTAPYPYSLSSSVNFAFTVQVGIEPTRGPSPLQSSQLSGRVCVLIPWALLSNPATLTPPQTRIPSPLTSLDCSSYSSLLPIISILSLHWEPHPSHLSIPSWATSFLFWTTTSTCLLSSLPCPTKLSPGSASTSFSGLMRCWEKAHNHTGYLGRMPKYVCPQLQQALTTALQSLWVAISFPSFFPQWPSWIFSSFYKLPTDLPTYWLNCISNSAFLSLLPS